VDDSLCKNPSSCNVRNLKDTEDEDLKRQSMLLHTDLSVILTAFTTWSVAPTVEVYEKTISAQADSALTNFSVCKIIIMLVLEERKELKR
jgi:hypothetical protein